MRIAFLITAHNTPNHLRSLIKALQGPDSEIFIHIDKKAYFPDFAGIQGDHVHLAKKRIPVYWGEYSGVSAITLLIKQALSQGPDFNYFVWLSGSDYPLRSISYIYQFLEQNKGTEFINLVKMPCEKARKPIYRLEKYYCRSDVILQKYPYTLLKRLGIGRSLWKRDYTKYLGKLVPYGGSAWWALTNTTCRDLIHFIDNNKAVTKFYENTFIPDELFFHTIIGNSPQIEKVKRNLTYTDWSAGGRNPAIITENHIKLFESQPRVIANDVYGEGELLFARKFPDRSEALVEKINKMVQQRG